MFLDSLFSRSNCRSNRQSMLLALLRGRRRRRRSALARARHCYTHSSVELLEDRTLLATFDVTILADELDAAHGGVDLDTGLSLREAIIDANNNPGPDTINVPAGDYSLEIPNTAGPENLAAEGDLDITDDVTIGGAGPETTNIFGTTGLPLASVFRVFHVLNGATVEFRDLGIRDGLASDTGTAAGPGRGGGILVTDSTVTLNGVDVDSNTSTADGGGIYADDSTLNIINDTFIGGNTAVQGGGIFHFGGTVNISASDIVGNQAMGADGVSAVAPGVDGGDAVTARGGGIYSSGGMLNISLDSVVASNSAVGGLGGDAIDFTAGTAAAGANGGSGGLGGDAFGGGLYLTGNGTVDISDTEFSGNVSQAGGGGFGGSGQDSLVEGGNGGAGGAGGESEGGGIYIGDGAATITIARTPFLGNVAVAGQGGSGGNGGDAGNTAASTGGQGGDGGNGGAAGPSSGGGIYINSASLDVSGSEFSGNSSIAASGGRAGAGGRAFDVAGNAGSGGNGGDAVGGGIGLGVPASSVSVALSRFLSNTVQAGSGGSGGTGPSGGNQGGNGGSAGRGGDAGGGGLFADSGTIDVDDSEFVANNVTAGSGGFASSGGDSNLLGGFGGQGGRGGNAGGGGIGVQSSGGAVTLDVQRSTLFGNMVTAGNAGGGGRGGDGATSTSITYGIGGNAGAAGMAGGGGLFADAVQLTLTNSTVSNNFAMSGSGSSGGDSAFNGGAPEIAAGGSAGGDAGGGGVHADGALAGSAIDNSTITLNNNFAGFGGFSGTSSQGTPGMQEPNGQRAATGLAVLTSPLTMNNTILAQNSDNLDVTGTVAGDGNFVGNVDGEMDQNVAGTGNQQGSLGGAGVIDADLGALAANGGLGLTHKPNALSPVIDAGHDAAIPAGVTTDQRGFARINPPVDVGAVEVQQQGIDWGDAPDDGAVLLYETLAANNGAAHGLGSGLFLGSEVDPDPDGQPNVDATGDDTDAVPNDEDGIVGSPVIRAGSMNTIEVIASAPGLLDAWLDVNGNGMFDHPLEHIAGGTSVALVAGSNFVDFELPSDAIVDLTFARLRVSTTGGLAPFGAAVDGEVEDYMVEILADLPPEHIVGRDPGSGVWWQARSDGSSSFTNQDWGFWSPGVMWEFVNIGDVNNDGNDDIVGWDPGSGNWWVALHNGIDSYTSQNWGFWSPGVDWEFVNVADVNNDGNDDIVGRDPVSGNWWVALSNGAGSFTSQNWGLWSLGVAWKFVNVADVNNDGNDDIVGWDPGSGNWWVALSDGSSSFTNQNWGFWSPGATWLDVNVADVNNDGNADIVGRDQVSGNWWVALSDGSSSFTNQLWGLWATGVTWTNVKIADVNADGNDDIIGWDPNSGIWWVALSNGAGSFANQAWGFWSTGVVWDEVVVADFDGDGDDDIAGWDPNTGNWWVARSNGTDTFTNELWGNWINAVDWAFINAFHDLP